MGKDLGPGRPEKTLADSFSEWGAWKQDILDLYIDGASDVEVKALIAEHCSSISNDLWTRWMKEEKDFSETIKKGRQFSQAWWEFNGRTNLSNQKFNYTGWYMNMRNRFAWRDRTDITTGDEPIKSVDVVFKNYKSNS